MSHIIHLKNQILQGEPLSDEQAYDLLDLPLDEICALAGEVTEHFSPRRFDSCSIINARSGRCPENCKWCAQSAHYSTGCDTYDIVDEDECMKEAKYNASKGVRRFSLVASGRAVKGATLDRICALARRVGEETPMSVCASLGLLGKDELEKLWESGVRRYHCNLESAPSHFKTLCSTHTIEDKIDTIQSAREVGFEICSGGIIGMGESARQRVEFALALRKISPDSIPINILCPIPGTPLENTAPLSEDEIMQTVAIFRLIHPKAQLRFAGGRTKLSRDAQIKAMHIGINGAITGDMLTTTGTTIDSDTRLISDAGYTM